MTLLQQVNTVALNVPEGLVTDVVDALVQHAYVLARCGADLETDGAAKAEFAERSLALGYLHSELSRDALAKHGKAY